MCKTKTIASKKHFFHQIINFFVSPLRVPWRSRTLRPLGNLQGRPRDVACWLGCFLIFPFWSCLLWISVSITTRAIFTFTFCVPCFIAAFTLAKLGMSSCTFACLLGKSSNFLATRIMPGPFFLLLFIGWNILN